jgi:hypothetical protein
MAARRRCCCWGSPTEHEAWVLAVLTGELHMTAEQIEALDAEQAKQLVLDHWARRQT